MLDYFRGSRPWPQLVRLVRRLPPLSHYQRALSSDDDLAEFLAREPATAQGGRPDSAAWGEIDEVCATVVDAANAIRQTLLAVNTPKGKKAPQLPSLPRPLTAWERAERRRERAALDEIVALATPGRRLGG